MLNIRARQEKRRMLRCPLNCTARMLYSPSWRLQLALDFDTIPL